MSHVASVESCPLTREETVLRAAGYVEELGLVGHLSVSVSNDHYAHGAKRETWRGYFRDGDGVIGRYVQCYESSADLMLKNFRMKLAELAASIAPALPSVEG